MGYGIVFRHEDTVFLLDQDDNGNLRKPQTIHDKETYTYLGVCDMELVKTESVEGDSLSLYRLTKLKSAELKYSVYELYCLRGPALFEQLIEKLLEDDTSDFDLLNN